ncbi:MAG: hypothetical protein ACLGI6_05160, partial [Gammaproteobacteria bacterium]
GTPVEPADMFGNTCIAMMAIQTADRHIKPDPPIQAVTITNSSPPSLVNQSTWLEACAATGIALGAFSEDD